MCYIDGQKNKYLTFHPLEKANAIADCLEKQFTPHGLSEENHKRQVEARVQDLLKAVDINPPMKGSNYVIYKN
jgi:hypothetical protein